VVFIVRVDDPEPVIVEGLNPPLVTPLGNGDSLATVKLTGPVKPETGVTVTVKLVDWPGLTVVPDGPTEMWKSGAAGVTVTTLVGGLGSEFPLASTTVSDAVYLPGVAKVTLPGFCAVEVAGVPPGKTQEYFEAAVAVPNETAPPAVMVTSVPGEPMAPSGGALP
jgi:hypothetical protein